MPLFALCVGISNYTRIGRIPGALTDLAAVVSKCEALGFEVVRLEDVANDDLHDAIGAFIERVSTGDTAFVYFSGHGLQFLGDNYFVPIDYGSRAHPDPRRHAFPIYSNLITALKERRPRLSYIALDACRAETIPVGATTTKAGGRGFSKTEMLPL